MLRRTNLQPAKRRQNLAQGEASAASETLGSRSLKKLAGFSGRQSVGLLALSLVLIVMPSCQRTGGGISSRTGGLPQSSAMPAQVSSSAEVVKITTESVQSSPGSSAEAVVKLAITSGYHVNANPATYSYLIATEVKLGNTEGITAGTPAYPVATKQKFEFAEEPLAVYEGNVEVKLPLKIGATAAAGERALPITVRVQACDQEKCFPPATINATIPVEVK